MFKESGCQLALGDSSLNTYLFGEYIIEVLWRNIEYHRSMFEMILCSVPRVSIHGIISSIRKGGEYLTMGVVM